MMVAMMQSTRLPLPEVIELLDVPTEFGALPRHPPGSRTRCVAAALASGEGPTQTRLDRVQVWHLEDPRASVFALFA